MAWELGWSGKVKITANSVETIGTTDAVKLTVVNPENDDTGNVLIFMTPKSMGIARAQLKIAGFDTDARSLAELVVNATALAGNEIPIYVDEYNGKEQLRIETRRVPNGDTLTHYDKMLRNEKKDRTSPQRTLAAPPSTADDEDNIPF